MNLKEGEKVNSAWTLARQASGARSELPCLPWLRPGTSDTTIQVLGGQIVKMGKPQLSLIQQGMARTFFGVWANGSQRLQRQTSFF